MVLKQVNIRQVPEEWESFKKTLKELKHKPNAVLRDFVRACNLGHSKALIAQIQEMLLAETP
jgi:hypothetical protein